MPQTRLYIETDEKTARALQKAYEFAFEDDGYAISAFEDQDAEDSWEVSVYVETDLAEALQTRMLSLAGDNGLKIELAREDLEDTDWVAKTLRELTCVHAGQFIVHGSHDADKPRPHEIAVQIDAGLAFGTGHHGTTAGCLDMLARVLKRRSFDNVLDLGTGSGVLAIATAKATPCFVLATDIDPVSTTTARDNAKINGVQAYVECITSVGFTNARMHQQAPYDLILANILAKPLQSLALDIAAHTAPGGTIILSGLLPHQRAPLVATFRLQGVTLEHYHIRDGWLTLLLHKA